MRTLASTMTPLCGLEYALVWTADIMASAGVEWEHCSASCHTLFGSLASGPVSAQAGVTRPQDLDCRMDYGVGMVGMCDDA